MIRTPIIDHITEVPVDVDKHHRSLNIIDKPHEFKIPLFEHLKNSNNSINMNLNGSLDTTTNIWNGTGDAGSDWAWTDQGYTVESNGSAYSGTQGLYVKLHKKDHLYFTSTPVDFSSATILQFWIQPKTYWKNKGKLKIELKLNNSHIGKELNIIDYMNGQQKNVWQLVTIPLIDFEAGQIGTVDKIEIEADEKKYFWFDDFNFGSPDIGNDPNLIRFTLQAEKNIRYFVNNLNITIIDDSESGPNSWDGNKFGNMNPLNSAIQLKYIKENKVLKYWNFKDNSDLIEISTNIQSLLGLTKSIVTFRIQFPTLVFKSTMLNKFEADIKDDISGLDKLSIALEGYTIDEQYFIDDRNPGRCE